MFEIFRAVSEKREPTVVRTLELLAGNDDMLKEFILVNRETKGDEGSLREFFKFAAVYAKISGYPQRCVNDLQGLGSAGQEELPSIVSTASGSLGCFNTQTVINRTSYSDISLADLRNYRKDPRFPNGASTTIYLDTPLKETETYAAINGLFIECAAAHLISEPDSIAEQRRVHFVLDEFHTLPKMDSLFNIPALGRGKGVQVTIIGQQNSQIAEKVGDRGFEILQGAIGVKLYFTQNDKGTAETVSKMIGNTTKRIVQQSSVGGGLQSLLKPQPRSVSLQAFPLLEPSSLMSLLKLDPEKKERGKLLVLYQGFYNRPIMGQPCVWFWEKRLKKRVALNQPQKDFVEGTSADLEKPVFLHKESIRGWKAREESMEAWNERGE